MAGGGNYTLKTINFVRRNSVQVYLGGAAALYGIRWYQTKSCYNYWFGKIEFDRRVERNQL